MISRSNYWSCSSFANWIRGVSKPSSETLSGWEIWRDNAMKKNPYRYWIAEKLLNRIQNLLHWPTDKLYYIKCYISNRWISKSHQLTAHSKNIKPGEWREFGFRILPCLFDELVNFVEIDLAHRHNASVNKKYKNSFHLFKIAKPDPQSGIEYLKQIVNHDSAERISAEWILNAYDWWQNQRPARADPNQISGWSDYCKFKRSKEFNLTEDEKDIYVKKILDIRYSIQDEYDKEDSKWLKELIDQRNNLWI